MIEIDKNRSVFMPHLLAIDFAASWEARRVCKPGEPGDMGWTLRPEIRQWCEENDAMPVVIYSRPETSNFGFWLTFEDDLKAMLFKLRWL